MKEILMFYRDDCGYCDMAFRALEELERVHSEYAEIPFRKVEETQDPDYADKFDYYATPTFYVGDEKIFEAHLGCPLTVVLGYTRCGAVGAAIAGSEEGYIKSITDEIHLAIGSEKDERKASELNVRRNVHLIQEAFADHPELQTMNTVGAVYDVDTGKVDWLS